MVVRDVHGLFGLKPPAPPRSTWHDRLRVRHKLRGIAPHRPSAWTRLVRNLPLAAMVAGCVLIAGGGRLLPEEVVLEIATATLVAVLLVAVLNYPSTCSALLGSRPITVPQIAAFAELTPPDIWERVRRAIDEQMQLRVQPLSFASVASDVMIAASRAAAEDPSSSQNQLRRRQVQAFKLAEPIPRQLSPLRPRRSARRSVNEKLEAGIATYVLPWRDKGGTNGSVERDANCFSRPPALRPRLKTNHLAGIMTPASNYPSGHA